MNNIEKLMLISGVTDFAFYNYKTFPEVNCYNFYKDYVQHINSIVKKESFSPYKNRRLNFQFINRFDINGSAFVKNGEDYIHINEGAQYKVYSTFSELIIKGAFSEYTDIKQIVSSQVYLNNEDITEQQFTFNIPDDYNAKLLSEYLSMIAMKFIILHELGHHMNGHLLYIEEQYGIDIWYTRLNDQKVPDLLIKTLEMDADAFAISQLVREFKDITQNDNKFGKLSMNNEIKLGVLIFSLHILFIILGEESESENNSGKYMPRKMRYMHNLSCLKTNLEIQYPEFLNTIDFYSVASYYLKKSESLYHKVFNFNNKLIDDIGQIIDAYKDFDEVKNTWNLIYDNLIKFARIPIAFKYK